MLSDPFRLSDAEIDRLIEEDVPFGDLTTRLAGIGDKPGQLTFHARDTLVLSGIEEAQRIFRQLGAEIGYAAEHGQEAEAGSLLLVVQGEARALHAGWKAAQVVMEWSSGVATATAAIVAAARLENPHIVVAVTRKNPPFTKKLALKAALAGGAQIHRFGLSDSVLLFPEHRTFIDPPEDIAASIARMRAQGPEQSVAVEVTTPKDALAAQSADVIQLEKFAPHAVAALRGKITRREDGRPVLAAAGGITEKNAGVYAKAGADVLVTSAPFQAGPTDIRVRFSPVEEEDSED